MARPAFRDLITGLLFAVIGIAGLLAAYGYPIGTMRRIGPGAFPLLVSGTLSLIGVALFVRSLPLLTSARFSIGHFNPTKTMFALLLVVGSLLAFAFLIRPLGLVCTSLICAAISYTGAVHVLNTRGSVVEGAMIALSITVFALLVFVYGIGLPIKVWP